MAVVTASSIWSDTPVENSVAARHIDHPVMQDLQSIWGRGPLWRAAARLFDIECAARAELPAIQSPGKGCAIVPATRGSYAIKIRTDNSAANHVTSMDRRTPTDALLAKNGILDRVLDSLPVDKFSLSPLIMDILDPCSPVRLREVQNA